MYGVTLAHFIFENNLREILLCFTLSLQLKKTPRNPPLSLSLFSDCCTTQLKRDPRRAAGDIYKCSRRRRSLPPPSPPGFPFGAKPRRASRRPPACSLLFPPRRPGRNSAHQLWSSGAAGGKHRAPQGGAASPRAAASLSLAQLSFIVGVARRPPPLLFSPPHLHLSPGRGGRRRSQ